MWFDDWKLSTFTLELVQDSIWENKDLKHTKSQSRYIDRYIYIYRHMFLIFTLVSNNKLLEYIFHSNIVSLQLFKLFSLSALWHIYIYTSQLQQHSHNSSAGPRMMQLMVSPLHDKNSILECWVETEIPRQTISR